MKLKCVEKTERHDPSFSVGTIYDIKSWGNEFYFVDGDDGLEWSIDREKLEFAGFPQYGVFEIVEKPKAISVDNSANTTEPVMVATLRNIQEQCSRANLSISIDPEGFNVFDCDNDMQTQVDSVAEVIEILETKIDFKDSMGKWGWL